MKEKLDPMITEGIFAIAVSLFNSGRMRSEIYLSGNKIYILNFDNTILLQFLLPERINFPNMGFAANNYDGPNFDVKDEKVIFRTIGENGSGFNKIKTVPSLKRTFDDIDGLFNKFDVKPSGWNEINCNDKALALFDETLSHIEILSENKKLLFRQRDIYSGNNIELSENSEGKGKWATAHKIKEDFGPFGIRTIDFLSIFMFFNRIKFLFKDNNYCIVKGERRVGGDEINMNGIIAGCLYDEMIDVKNILSTEEKDHGRKIKEIGERKQTSAVEVDEGKGTKGTKKKATTRRKTAKQPAVKGLGINSK